MSHRAVLPAKRRRMVDLLFPHRKATFKKTTFPGKISKSRFFDQNHCVKGQKNLKNLNRGENEFSSNFVFSVFSVVNLLSTSKLLKKKKFFRQNF